MSDVHQHLVLNHFTLVGLAIGTLVLIFGFLLKKEQIKATALGIFVFSAIMAIVANYTGEGAEHAIENLPGINEQYIETHEDAAEVFLAVILVLGGASLVTMFLAFKNIKLALYGYILVVLLVIASTYTAIEVGSTGGEIRHTEIRSDSALYQQDQKKDIKTNEDDD